MTNLRVAMYHCKLPQPGRKPGGVEVFVHRLANALVDRGHAIEVRTYSDAPPDARYAVKRLRPRVVEGNKALRQYLAPWSFNAWDSEDFDLVHLHGDDWFYLRRGKPSVRSFHGSARFEAESATSWRRRIDKRIVFRLELLANRLATASYAVGADADSVYRTDGILGLGVDAAAGPRRPSAAPSILFVGTWDGRKRGRFLQEVFTREVRPTHPGAELWMVSDHAEPAPGVRHLGSPDDQKLRELYGSAWLFCLPSTYEGLGIPYLEAMAAGAPVVSSSNPGARHLLRDGRHGRIVADDGLGATLTALLGDAPARATLAADGRERAADFTWDAVVAEYEAAYELAVARSSARSSARSPAASR